MESIGYVDSIVTRVKITDNSFNKVSTKSKEHQCYQGVTDEQLLSGNRN